METQKNKPKNLRNSDKMCTFALATKVDSSTSEVDEQYHFQGQHLPANNFLLQKGAKDWSPAHLFSFLTLYPLFYCLFFVYLKKKHYLCRQLMVIIRIGPNLLPDD